jgi:hypothetical protein
MIRFPARVALTATALVVLAASVPGSAAAADACGLHTDVDTGRGAGADTVLVTRERPDPDKAVAALTGEFRWIGGTAERKARDKAIDDVVDGMNFIVRGIARKRLKQANPIPRLVRIRRAGEDVLVIRIDKRVYRAKIGGPAVTVVGITGDELKLTHRVVDNRVVQRFEGESGGRVNTFTPLGKGDDKGMKLRVRVFSDKLPKDLVYGLSYRHEE